MSLTSAIIVPKPGPWVFPIILQKDGPSWTHAIQSVQPIWQPWDWPLHISLHFQCFHSHTLYFSLYLEFRFLICLLQLILQLSAKHGFLRDTLPTYRDLKYVPLLYPLVALQFSIVAPISIKPNYSFMQLYLMKGSMTVTKNRLWNQIKLKSWLITF